MRFKIFTKRALMGTEVAITIIHDSMREAVEAMKAAFKEITRVESIMSIYDSKSEVFKLNKVGYLSNPSPELRYVLDRALEYYDRSMGLFDIAIERDELNENQKPVLLKDEFVKLPKGVRRISLGGIAKGYAVDRAAMVLRSRGIRSALIDAGGDIAAIGEKVENEPWRIGIKDPLRKEDLLMVVKLSDRSIATSGIYEKSGVKNPKTGEFVEETLSATVIHEKTIDADVLATIALISPEIGLKLAEANQAELLIIRRSGELLSTPGFHEYLERDAEA
ncbi:MAG: hypothetical protein DRN68_03730 [Thaumarchaeota archaeon]|nr:MAG: hypothetical protein DRN68_03730 [Nitrososphaerota archaeon]